MTPREYKYPGKECGLSEDEWCFGQINDWINTEGSLVAIGRLRKTVEHFQTRWSNVDVENIKAADLEKFFYYNDTPLIVKK